MSYFGIYRIWSWSFNALFSLVFHFLCKIMCRYGFCLLTQMQSVLKVFHINSHTVVNTFSGCA